MNRKPRVLSFLFACVLLFALTGCRDASPQPTAAPSAQAAAPARYTRRGIMLFDTEISLSGFAESREDFDRAADELNELLSGLNQLFDGYNAYGSLHNLYYVNQHASQAPVDVPQDFYDLLSWCRDKWRSGFQRTNVAMGSVLKIWHEYRTAGILDPEHAALPPLDALQSAAAHCNFDDLVLDDAQHTVYFADPALQLDLGAVAKGYAADRAAELLRAEMPSFLLSLGGNVYAGGAPLDGRSDWNVGVQDPRADQLAISQGGTDILDVLEIHGLTAVTSGDYWRYYTVDGKNYHHIIDPDTLFPSEKMASVTIVCESSLLADYLSTALFTLSYEDGLRVLEEIGGVEALWVEKDGAIRATPGMARYSRMLRQAESEQE